MTRSAWTFALGLTIACQARPATDAEALEHVEPQTTVAETPPESTGRELEARILGRTVGHSTTEREVLPDGGERWTVRTTLTLALDDPGENASEIRTIDVTEYGPGRVFVRSHETSRENGIENTEELERVGNRLVLRTTSPDHRDEASFEIPAGFRSDLEVFDEVVREAKAGAKLPIVREYIGFDDESRRFGTNSLTLHERVREQSDGRSFEAWRVESRDIDGEITTAVIDDAGVPLRLTFGAFAMVPVGEAADTSEPTKLSSYIPVEGNVGNDARVDLELSVTDDDPKAPPAVPSNDYQSVTRTKGGYRLELHAMRLPADAKVPRLPMQPPADVRPFLAPTPASQSDAPEIVELATKLRAGRDDTDAVARDIVTWVFENLGKRDGTRGAATATETLAAGHGDCTEHAALAVALLRAAGIPARNADGIVLVPGWFTADAGYHAWPEVWLGRWVVLDPALGRLDVAAHYILFGYDEPGAIGGSRSIARLIGRTRIAIDR